MKDEENLQNKTNISQNESHNPLNSMHGQTFNLLNAIHKKEEKKNNEKTISKNSLNLLQKRISSNKEYKEDKEEEKNSASKPSSLISGNDDSYHKKKKSLINKESKSFHSNASETEKSQKSENKNVRKSSESSSDSKKSKDENKKNNASKNKSSNFSDDSESISSKSDTEKSKQNEEKNERKDNKSSSSSSSNSKSKNKKSKTASSKSSYSSKSSKSVKEEKKEKSESLKKEKNKSDSEENKSSEESEEINSINDIKNNEINNRKLYKREKICDTDTEDEESENEKEIPWIILPDNPYKKLWDLLIALLILYSAIVTPYDIAFSNSNNVNVFEIFIDIFMGIDIILTFFSAYTDDEENLVKNQKKIIKRYLKSWFIIDILSVLPISYFFKANKSNIAGLTKISKLPKIYRLVKLTKLLRMTKMNSKGNLNRVTKFFMEKLKINANIERLFFFILTFLLLNHLCACFWYFMAKLEDFSPDSWVVRLGYIDSSNIELYIISFYWTLTTVTTVGYGDITAGTTIERVYNLFIMSFGVLLYSFAIGSLSSIVSTLDQKSEEMNQKLQILSSIKKEFNLDQNIYDKVRKVIKYDLSKNQKDKMIFLQELPNKLRIELSQIMHDKVIQNFYFFRDQPSDFFAYVAPLLKPVKFSQNDYLYKCQDMIDEMYFVAKGTVIFCLDKKYGEKEIREIKKNNNFGEIEMCLNEKLTFNIKIKSRNCELFVLKKNDFLRLSVNFKEFIENFLHKSLMKYLKFNEEKNKMIKEFDALMNITENSQDEEEGEETSEEEEDEEGEEEDDEGDNGSLQSIDEEGSGSSSGSNSRNENENEGNEKKNEMIDSKSDNDSKSDKDKNDRIINLNEMEKESN